MTVATGGSYYAMPRPTANAPDLAIAYNCAMRSRQMRALARGLIVAALVLGAGPVACHHGQQGPSDQEEPTPQARTTLRVENQRFQDMDIYAVYSTQRLRLGTVNGNSTTIFEIPRSLVNGVTQLRFLASPIGGSGTPISDEITVRPGDQIGLTIPPY